MAHPWHPAPIERPWQQRCVSRGHIGVAETTASNAGGLTVLERLGFDLTQLMRAAVPARYSTSSPSCSRCPGPLADPSLGRRRVHDKFDTVFSGLRVGVQPVVPVVLGPELRLCGRFEQRPTRLHRHGSIGATMLDK